MSASVNGTPTFAEVFWMYRVLCASWVVAFTINVYNWLLTLANEWKYIWRRPQLHIWVKALVLVLRYVSLGTQLVLCSWILCFMPMYYPVPLLVCRNYRVFLTFSLLIQLYSIDCLMILRVWLVFNRGMKFLLILILAFICQVSIVVATLFRLFSGLGLDGLCTAHIPLLNYILFWLAGFIVHTTSWLFTMYQCYRARRQGFGRSPLVWLLERDGSYFWLSFGVILISGVIIGHTLSPALAPITDPWIISSASVLGCRMIMNVQRLAYDDEAENVELSSTVMFTTDISPFMSDAAWSRVDGHLVDAFVNAQLPESPEMDPCK